VTGFTSRPTNEALSGVAEQLDQKVCDALSRAELPARHIKYGSPPPPQDKLQAETARVLVHLFRAESIDERADRFIAHTLQMDGGMLRYHLDMLHAAGFANRTSARDGMTYWAITPNGRRYAVDRKLIGP
jgi:hypothetical protein